MDLDMNINQLKKQQLKLIEKRNKIIILPSAKRPSTVIKRAFKLMALTLECELIQKQINYIIKYT